MSAHSYRLLRTTHIPGEIGDVFRFFKDPHNLEAITPPWLRFRISSTSEPVVGKDTRIRYRLSLGGIPLWWESRITEFVENSHFADEQLSGPYARWYHRHRFRAVNDGVEMIDEVEYGLPFGALGRLVHWLVVRRTLQAIFDYRTMVIKTLLSDARSQPPRQV